MKKLIGFLLLLLFLVVVLLPFLRARFSGGQQNKTEIESVSGIRKYLQYTPGKQPLVAAHRGGPMPSFPENAIATFENAVKLGAAIIECDVRKSLDGKLVLMHDETLDRTTNGLGYLNQFAYAELKKLRLKDNQGELTQYEIPAFSVALEWGENKAILEVDVKDGVQPQEVIEQILAHKALNHTVVITYNLSQLQTYMNLNSELMISASAHTVEGVRRLLDTGIDPARLMVFVGVTEPDPAVYQLLHENKIRAILGTMHNIDNSAEKHGIRVYEKVLENGADILATDNVPLAVKAIREFSAKKIGSF